MDRHSINLKKYYGWACFLKFLFIDLLQAGVSIACKLLCESLLVLLNLADFAALITIWLPKEFLKHCFWLFSSAFDTFKLTILFYFF